ncbi:MAG: DUF6684 family protein [Haloarculaceae archaeon]
MALLGFEKDTLLDLTVNVIPLAIIVFFVGAFAVLQPFGIDPVFSAMQFAILVTMLVALSILTYYAGKVIERDEKREGELGHD